MSVNGSEFRTIRQISSDEDLCKYVSTLREDEAHPFSSDSDSSELFITDLWVYHVILHYVCKEVCAACVTNICRR